MRFVTPTGTTSTLSAKESQSVGPMGYNGAPSTTLTAFRGVVPVKAKLYKFVCAGAEAGAGKKRTIEVMKNGVGTGAKVVFEGTSKEGVWEGEPVIYEPGDNINLVSTVEGEPTGSSIGATLFWETTGNQAFFFSAFSATPSTSLTSFPACLGWGSIGNTTTEGTYRIVIPEKITVKALYVLMNGPSGAAKSYTISLRKNLATDFFSTKLEGSGTESGHTEGTQVVEAGETLETKIVPAGTPNTRAISIGVLYEPATPGNVLMGAADTAVESATVLNVAHLIGNTSTWGTGSANRHRIASGITINNLRVEIGTAPGTGKKRVFTFGDINATVGPSAIIEGEAKTGSATGPYETGAESSVSFKTTPTGEPAADTGVHWGFTLSIPQPLSEERRFRPKQLSAASRGAKATTASAPKHLSAFRQKLTLRAFRARDTLSAARAPAKLSVASQQKKAKSAL